MGTKRNLARRLSDADRFVHPRIDLEQYATPADLAAHIVHYADLQGDIRDRVVLDLGSGPGILSLGCAYRQPRRVVGVEIDRTVINLAVDNARVLDPPVAVEWIRGDATRPPICRVDGTTVIMNPPFGAQQGNVHADRAFLQSASRLADVSYSLHNAGSEGFIEAFTADNGGTIRAINAVSFDLAYQFEFHEETVTTVDAELYRITWNH